MLLAVSQQLEDITTFLEDDAADDDDKISSMRAAVHANCSWSSGIFAVQQKKTFTKKSINQFNGIL